MPSPPAPALRPTHRGSIVAPMPRRTQPNPLALKVGQRLRQLREEAGLTMEKVAGTAMDKGHVSSIERGLLIPNLATLRALADGLGMDVVDLVIDPESSDRHRLIEATRDLPPAKLRRVLSALTTAK
jgi:transcriptional regulator with XRE-family HTH domain